MPYLVVTCKGQELYRVSLTGPVVIGRDPSADICVNLPALSRKHCRVEQTLDGSWAVIDLQSRNGVHVRNHKVDRCFLVNEFEFQISEVTVTFFTGRFRSATPNEALMMSNPLRPDLALSPRDSLANEATITHVHRPIVPDEVDLRSPTAEEVQPFALPFQRPAAKPVLTNSEDAEKIEAIISPGSRRWLSSWMRSLRKRGRQTT